MSYIIFVNPPIMSETGMDHGAIFVGTCLGGCCVFFSWVCLPIGHGARAWYGVERLLHLRSGGRDGHSWQTALAAVFIAGILFFIISVTPLVGGC